MPIFGKDRGSKVVSLISFDVRGARNDVLKDALLRRLEAKGVPQMLVEWIDAFCSNREVTMARAAAKGLSAAMCLRRPERIFGPYEVCPHWFRHAVIL